ncbi:MAG: hypothetical protein SFU91_04225 [Chloroherpetonaceae bacterium]|nr:hypothetical protein [Chloroherpetonaceae bacterium]
MRLIDPKIRHSWAMQREVSSRGIAEIQFLSDFNIKTLFECAEITIGYFIGKKALFQP